MIAATVVVFLSRLSGLGALLKAKKAMRPYALATVQERRFGRTAPVLATATGDFPDVLDLAAEETVWAEVVLVASGETVTLTWRIIDDRGDEAHVELWKAPPISLVDPWMTGTFTSPAASGEPTLTYRVETRPVPSGSLPAAVPRIAPGTSGTLATLGARPVLVTELTHIDGLYRPVGSGGGTGGARGAEAVEGYASRDHQGRIYVNRAYGDRSWKKGYQAIRARVTVTAVRGAVPPGAKMRWQIQDRDDPSNDAPEVHRQWHRLLDPADCDEKGEHVGTRINDNQGTLPSPRWEQSGAFSLAVQNKMFAETDIVDMQSEVIIHCPDLSGDNLNLIATVNAFDEAECVAARTGTMTMWSLVEVEHLRMKSAASIEGVISNVQPYFDPACIQFDFTGAREIADVDPLVANPQGRSDNDVAMAIAMKEFSKREIPGWFCVVAALRCDPIPPVLNGDARWRRNERVTLRALNGTTGFFFSSIPDPSRGTVSNVRLHDDTQSVMFSVKASETVRGPWYVLEDHQLFPNPRASDRGKSSAVRVNATPAHYGFKVFSASSTNTTEIEPGFVTRLDINLASPKGFGTTGLSPMRTLGKRPDTFWGVTMVFTTAGAFVDEKGQRVPTFDAFAARTLVHELVHGLGLPHICGYFNLTAPRKNACTMQYGYIGLWQDDAETRLAYPPVASGLATSSSPAQSFCGEHISELRKIRLHEHEGFLWHDKQ